MIRVGQGAAHDPVLSYTSAVATALLRQAAQRPAAQRLEWLRGDLNRANAGLGDEFISKATELRRRGRAGDQAVFDALRLVLANKVATRLATGGSLGALGESRGDISAAFCGITGTAGAGGVIVSTVQRDPAGTTAVGEAMQRILQGQGCSSEALAQQNALMQQQLMAMAAQGNSIEVSAGAGAIPWVIGGVAALGVFGLLGYLALRKKS